MLNFNLSDQWAEYFIFFAVGVIVAAVVSSINFTANDSLIEEVKQPKPNKATKKKAKKKK